MGVISEKQLLSDLQFSTTTPQSISHSSLKASQSFFRTIFTLNSQTSGWKSFNSKYLLHAEKMNEAGFRHHRFGILYSLAFEIKQDAVISSKLLASLELWSYTFLHPIRQFQKPTSVKKVSYCLMCVFPSHSLTITLAKVHLASVLKKNCSWTFRPKISVEFEISSIPSSAADTLKGFWQVVKYIEIVM